MAHAPLHVDLSASVSLLLRIQRHVLGVRLVAIPLNAVLDRRGGVHDAAQRLGAWRCAFRRFHIMRRRRLCGYSRDCETGRYTFWSW